MKDFVLLLIAIIILVFMFTSPEGVGKWGARIANGYRDHEITQYHPCHLMHPDESGVIVCSDGLPAEGRMPDSLLKPCWQVEGCWSHAWSEEKKAPVEVDFEPIRLRATVISEQLEAIQETKQSKK